MYIWNHKAYQGQYKYIEDDTSDKIIKIEAEVKIDSRSWGI